MAYGIAIKEYEVKEVYEDCVQGKITEIFFPKRSSRQTRDTLEIVHSDVGRPMQTIILNGICVNYGQ